MAQAPRDQNRVPAVLGVSNADGTTPLPPYVDSSTNRLLVNATITGALTEYTEGDTDTSITGTAIMWEDASDTLRAVSASKPLPVDIVDATGVTITVDSEFPTAGALADNTANPTTTSVGTFPHWYDGSTWDRALGNSTDGLLVNLGSNNDVSLNAGDNNIGNVDIVTVPSDPFGANADAASATGSISAKLRFIASTGIPITGTVTVDGSGVTQPISHAALTELAAAIDTEVQVDVVGALPAGTNAIGKLAANSGVDIGDVDVTSIIPGTGATNLGKAIDTSTGATDTGVLVLATRDDALGALTPIEGDNVQLRVDANGALWTHDDALDAALSGSELQVDVVAALPAGTNNIGDVDILSIAAGDNNIGNVDVASLPASTNTLEVVGDVAEDIALSGNPVRQGIRASAAEPTSMSGDGDVVTPWGDRKGRMVTTQKAGTGTVTSVADTDASTTLLAANTSRLGATIYNNSSEILYVKFGTTASATDFTIQMASESYYEAPYGYTGRIDGIWAANSTGAALITEIT